MEILINYSIMGDVNLQNVTFNFKRQVSESTKKFDQVGF